MSYMLYTTTLGDIALLHATVQWYDSSSALERLAKPFHWYEEPLFGKLKATSIRINSFRHSYNSHSLLLCSRAIKDYRDHKVNTFWHFHLWKIDAGLSFIPISIWELNELKAAIYLVCCWWCLRKFATRGKYFWFPFLETRKIKGSSIRHNIMTKLSRLLLIDGNRMDRYSFTWKLGI